MNYVNNMRILSSALACLISVSVFGQGNLVEFEHNGITRHYILHVPEKLPPQSPLVFNLHGGLVTAIQTQSFSQMDILANRESFAVCYPQGTGGSEDTEYTKKGTPFWNVGYETHKNETVDDVMFITGLAQHLQLKFNFDPEKTFCSGMSNGGDMSYLLACQAPSVFSAIAPITGCMMEWIYTSCDKENPIPIFQVHGTDDKTTHYVGDVENKDQWGAYMGVETTIKLWVDRNQCVKLTSDTLPDINKNDGSFVITEKYSGGLNNNEVWFYRVINGGHDWPQGWPQNSGNQDLNTSEEIWRFFKHTIINREI